jgi:hypothetical protein
MMSENIARNMYSSQEIINYPTQLHLVGRFRILYHDARKHKYQHYVTTAKFNRLMLNVKSSQSTIGMITQTLSACHVGPSDTTKCTQNCRKI